MLEPFSENVNAADIKPGDLSAPPCVSNAKDFKDSAQESLSTAPPKSPSEASTPDWREELAAKMQEYRTRRKPRGPKYPSLQLPFEMPFEKAEPFRPVTAEAASRSSLAIDRLAIDHSRDKSLDESALPVAPQLAQELLVSDPLAPETMESAPAVQTATPTTNLIEFPHYSIAPERDELAEPLIEYPRILDAPEVVPPRPALGGILLETKQGANLNLAAEVQLQPASIARRLLAAILDAFFVAAATALWGWIFLKLTHVVPPPQQLLIAGVLIPAALWLGYQYLLLVGTGTTVGLRACRLDLVSFDGSIPQKARRRWRLLASLLSAASLMLGYAWVLLDEDGLCWHDRITRTYLRPRNNKRRPDNIEK